MKDPVRILVGAKNAVVSTIEQKLVYCGSLELPSYHFSISFQHILFALLVILSFLGAVGHCCRVLVLSIDG